VEGASLNADDSLRARRLRTWGQTPETRVADPEAAAALIERLGVVTLYLASPEIPDLFHAYVGDPEAQTSATWDSPSGHVYTWRWELGRMEAGFYTAIVRGRPTFVSWALLPAILRLRGERRTPDELFDLGALSDNAYRIVQALEAAGGVLSTGELRERARFPAGKEQRAAYLKAVDELDTRLLLAKVFSPDDEEMRHALVSERYREQVLAADRMSEEEALERFLLTYLPGAVYILPAVLARHLKLSEGALRAALDRLAARDLVRKGRLEGQKGDAYVWTEV
jgi:hypothetical protein